MFLAGLGLGSIPCPWCLSAAGGRFSSFEGCFRASYRPWALQCSLLLSVPSWPVPAGFDISALVCRRRDLDSAGSHPREQPHLVLQLQHQGESERTSPAWDLLARGTLPSWALWAGDA